MIRMKRLAPLFQHWMVRLALLAILLVAMMPTISRVLLSNGVGMPAASMHAGHHGMTHHAATAMDGMVMPHGQGHDGHGQMHGTQKKSPSPMDDEVCDYCPLLSSLAPLVLLVLLLAAPQSRRFVARLDRTHAAKPPLLHGLGARGPPSVSALTSV